MTKRKNMKNSLLAYYLLIPVLSLGISKTGVCETYLSGEIEKVNLNAQQCSSQLPSDLQQVSKHFKEMHVDSNIPKYYLMAEAGLDHRYFLSNNVKLESDLKNPYANSQLNIKRISQRVADSVFDALDATRTSVEREYISLLQGPGDLSTYKEYSEVLAVLANQGAPSVKALEDKSQLIVKLLQHSMKYANNVTKIDTSATANYLHAQLGLTIEDYHTWRDDFFESSGLYNEKANSLHQLTRFIGYLAVRNQYNKLASTLVTGRVVKIKTRKTFASPVMPCLT
ncbi:hypothetical protein [Endozoicomonas lisbonensis]|uniref:Uncharacterized protein n=1 Tax=Endozoicomonas lisbonensis TaxID=3120522 RepID=A0ABV2SBD6_9GAMM